LVGWLVSTLSLQCQFFWVFFWVWNRLTLKKSLLTYSILISGMMYHKAIRVSKLGNIQW